VVRLTFVLRRNPDMSSSEFREYLRCTRGSLAARYYGHAELWFDRADLAAGSATPEGVKAVQVYTDDEKRFIDLPRSAHMGSEGAGLCR